MNTQATVTEGTSVRYRCPASDKEYTGTVVGRCTDSNGKEALTLEEPGNYITQIYPHWILTTVQA